MVSAANTYDVVVTGNGVPGLSLGVELARRGVRVAVVGRPRRPAVSMLSAFGEVTAGPNGRARLALARQGSALWPDWLASFDGEDLVTGHGTVIVLNTVGLPEVDTANYEAIRVALAEHGEDFEDVDPGDVEWLDPEPAARPLRAMFLPEEHAVDTAGLLARMEQEITRAGGVVIAADVVRIVESEGRVSGVDLDSGETLSADDVVLTTGAARAVPQVVNVAAVAALVEPEDGAVAATVIRTPNRAFAHGVHVLPGAAGQVLLGGKEVVTGAPIESAPVADTMLLLDSAARQVRRALGESGVRDIQVDNQPAALDGLPLVGATELPGLRLMTGTHRDTVTLSPLLARETANRILGEESTVDLGPCDPARPDAAALSRVDAVTATVTHLLAAGYESGWHTPVEWPAMLEATVATELYRNPPTVLGELGVRLRQG